MRFPFTLALLALLLGLVGCAGSLSTVVPKQKATGERSASLGSPGSRVGTRRGGTKRDCSFVVGCRGWHSSIIVERAAIPKGAWPAGVVERAFAGCRYVEAGWGDADFYMARHPTVLTALDAVLLPGASVLLVVGLDPPLQRALPWGGLERVPCSREEFDALCRAIGATFQLDKSGKAKAVGVGLYGRTSRFYPARGLYSGGQTCNHWTTRMMRAGGLHASLTPTATWSSGSVVAQARRLVKERAAAAAVAEQEPGARKIKRTD